ncbi:MAG: hypothetical protein HFG27_09995 [Provencibacterium sp.]|jgi:hypothetical protein|nr:hypothetical protein [Provencibacterium sp.]
MGTVRVYASDSMTADVRTEIYGPSYSYGLKDNYRRAATDEAYARYALTYSKSRVPAAEYATGVRVLFDLDAVPELQARAVTRITGPFLYLREKYSELFAGASYPLSFRGCTFDDVILRFLLTFPGDPAQDNHLGQQQPGKYFNVRESGQDSINLYQGIHRSMITVCLSAYPGVSGKRYEGRVRAVFDSATGEFPPYIQVEYKNSELMIAGCSPQSGFVNEKQPVRLDWSLVPCSPNAVGRATQKSASLQWRPKGSSSVQTVSVSGASTFCVLPANTLPNGSIEWRVSAVSADNVSAPWSDWYTLTTIDNQISAPDSLSPDGELLDGARPIALSWRHNSPLGTPPSAFEAQVDLETGYGWRELSGKILSSESAYTIPANTLPSGYVSWRVRDYNSDGQPSPWSSPARMTVRAAPRAPVFRTLQSGTARPLIQWFVSGQVALQIEITSGREMLYRSGTIFSTENSHRIPVLLPNGIYTLRLRIQNQYGLWSPWEETSLAIQAPKKWKVTLEGQEIEAGAQLSFHVQKK